MADTGITKQHVKALEDSLASLMKEQAESKAGFNKLAVQLEQMREARQARRSKILMSTKRLAAMATLMGEDK